MIGGLARGVLRSSGGKGMVAGAAVGGIYAASQAGPGESRFEQGLYGTGIGLGVGLLGGAVIGRGITKGKAAIAARRARGQVPVFPMESRLLAKGRRREGRVLGKAARRLRRMRRSPAAMGAVRGGGERPIRLNRRVGLRGAMTGAINKAKAYRRAWRMRHRARGEGMRIRAEEAAAMRGAAGGRPGAGAMPSGYEESFGIGPAPMARPIGTNVAPMAGVGPRGPTTQSVNIMAPAPMVDPMQMAMQRQYAQDLTRQAMSAPAAWAAGTGQARVDTSHPFRTRRDG
jgi:hypothetical protein